MFNEMVIVIFRKDLRASCLQIEALSLGFMHEQGDLLLKHPILIVIFAASGSVDSIMKFLYFLLDSSVGLCSHFSDVWG